MGASARYRRRCAGVCAQNLLINLESKDGPRWPHQNEGHKEETLKDHRKMENSLRKCRQGLPDWMQCYTEGCSPDA